MIRQIASQSGQKLMDIILLTTSTTTNHSIKVNAIIERRLLSSLWWLKGQILALFGNLINFPNRSSSEDLAFYLRLVTSSKVEDGQKLKCDWMNLFWWLVKIPLQLGSCWVRRCPFILPLYMYTWIYSIFAYLWVAERVTLSAKPWVLEGWCRQSISIKLKIPPIMATRLRPRDQILSFHLPLPQIPMQINNLQKNKVSISRQSWKKERTDGSGDLLLRIKRFTELNVKKTFKEQPKI